MGRFLNADGTINENRDILRQNLYAYCSNDFINCYDSNGKGLLKNVWNAVKKVVSNGLKFNPKPKVSQAIQIKQSFSPTNGHNNVPTTGKPNTTVQKLNGDYRSYGPDGRATTDKDYSHPERHPDLPVPHEHDWTWNGDKPIRGKAHAPNDSDTSNKSDTSKIVIGTVATVGAGYIVYRGIRMLPSLLPPFWWTIPINVATP